MQKNQLSTPVQIFPMAVAAVKPEMLVGEGGYGSGRSGGRPTVQDGLTLDLDKLIRDGLFRPGLNWGGSIVWTWAGTTEHVGSIGYQAFLGDEAGRVRLFYTTTRRTGEKFASDYWIELETTPQPFGGRRWWFVCPRSGRRVLKLYLPDGASQFASRQAYRLAYRSQRESARDRSLSRAFKIRKRLGNESGIGDFVLRPKGMRKKTFARHMAKLEAAEDVVEAYTALLLQHL